MHPLYLRNIPPRVRAAAWHIRTALRARARASTRLHATPVATPQQNAAHAAALEVLRTYIAGELEFDPPGTPADAAGPTTLP